jgi:hypothetical protein
MLRSLLRLLPALLLILLPAAPLHAPALIPPTGMQAPAPSLDAAVPSLATFVEQVRTGTAARITGIYAAEVFAYPVVQQPAGQPGFVSSLADTLTQFGMASTYGSLGFLAHNTLAGSAFSEVELYQLITVVYGDGLTTIYQVMDIRRFEATLPSSPYSSFVDLDTNKTLSAADLFTQTYGIRGTLVLQTCISKNGMDNWGRLFLIAVPYFPDLPTYH